MLNSSFLLCCSLRKKASQRFCRCFNKNHARSACKSRGSCPSSNSEPEDFYATVRCHMFTHINLLKQVDSNMPLPYAPKRPKKKRRGRDKLSKGLRHFSTRVCKKVEEKGKTSFNEVADEIVRDFIQSQESSGNGKPHNEKNIRRRVYDALNVLMAMNVITKKRKSIVWKGLPSNAQHDLELLKVLM